MNKILTLALVAILLSACAKNNSDPKPTGSVTINQATYGTVVIGRQTWTSVNYNGTGGVNYSNSQTNNPILGKLYTFDEAKSVVLPEGWRVPTIHDWNKLLTSIGGDLSTIDDTDYQMGNPLVS